MDQLFFKDNWFALSLTLVYTIYIRPLFLKIKQVFLRAEKNKENATKFNLEIFISSSRMKNWFSVFKI